MDLGKKRSPLNRTLTLSPDEQAEFRQRLITLQQPAALEAVLNRTICQDMREAVLLLPVGFADLLILDPPYNLYRTFAGNAFRRTSDEAYGEWVESWLPLLLPTLKPTASVYFCGDWQISPIVYFILKQYFIVRNRITWEREKGRGARFNWKSAAEDIWFCTVGEDYTFNVEAVKLKRKVYAPYRTEDGQPKDWQEEGEGRFRLTHPSNIWTDITVPFWSMPENTDHRTQKPEKLLAKLILASSNPQDVIFDPFLGSGTSAVVAKKLGRHFVAIEKEELYCCWAEKRLALAEEDASIQGYDQGVFWDRQVRRGRSDR